MAVSVLWPDGSKRNMPGHLVKRDKDGISCFQQIPINCDPIWLFVFEKGRWRAKPRLGPEIAHLPAREDPCWWEGIWQIREDRLRNAGLKTSLSSAA